MRINRLNSETIEESKLISICWTILALHFLTSGFIRGYVFPELSNYIYFLPLPVFIILIFKFFLLKLKLNYFGFSCLGISLFLFFYQVILLLGNQIDFKTTLYGWLLYGAPFLGIPAASSHLFKRDFLRIVILFEYALIPNFIFAFMQTIVGDSRFFSAGFGSGLVSAFGVQRATGLFSSPAGYALYLSITTALVLIKNKKIPTSRMRKYFFVFLLVAQLPISGSRTAIFSVVTVVLIYIIFSRSKEKKDELIIIRQSVVYPALILLGFFTFKKINLITISATIRRFQDANKLDPPLTRLKQQLQLNFEGVGLFSGTGLGSKAHANTVVGIDWVEFDAQRLTIESGIVIGILLLFWRVYLSWRCTLSILRSDDRYSAPLLGAVVPIILFGQFMGQGSISLGTWLGVFLIESLRVRELC